MCHHLRGTGSCFGAGAELVVVVVDNVPVVDGGCAPVINIVVADGHGGSGVLRCMEEFRDMSGGSVEILALLYTGCDSLFSVVCMAVSTVRLGLI